MSEEKQTSYEKLDELISEFNYNANILYRVKNELEELIDKYEKIIYEIPQKELNELIVFGFVPNAEFIFNNKELTFIGYANGNRMIFNYKGEKGNISAAVESVYKNLDKFKHNEAKVLKEAE